MPTYHYVCDKCEHEFELVQKMTDQPLKNCPQSKCGRKKWGKGKVRRLVSGGAGLIFKGSGFYITDYRSEGYKEAAKKDSESSAPKKEVTSKESAASTPASTPASTSTSASPPAPAKSESKGAKGKS